MSRPEIETGPPRWEAITLEKGHLDSFLIAIGNIYIGARTREMALPSACVTTYMNEHTCK